MKKQVLIMAGYYLPSVKGGGPIQSIKNMVENLSDKIDFYIVAADRDLGDDIPFETIDVDKWSKVGQAKVFYTDVSKLTWNKTRKIIKSSECETIYLNSFFSYKFATVPILLDKMKIIGIKKIVLAPRGQFSAGALGLRSIKKKLFIKMTRVISLYKNITWHATAEMEKRDIQSIFGDRVNLVVANNLTANYERLIYNKDLVKNIDELKIVFISRVHPKKNLKKAIEYLRTIKGGITFNIYGPIEDETYWNECQRAIDSLPSNIKVGYHGIVKHSEIMDIFKNHHVFLFPTLGENFGHVISESLIGGCPVIISDQTPWRELEERQLGWDIDLWDDKRFVEVIQNCVNLNNDEYKVISERAFKYAKTQSNSKSDIQKTHTLFC